MDKDEQSGDTHCTLNACVTLQVEKVKEVLTM